MPTPDLRAPYPLPDLDALDVESLRERVSEKWSTYPPDVLPAWVAEMDYPLAEPVRRVLERAARSGDVGYPLDARATGLAEVFAERMHERFGWRVDPARVELLADVVQGLYVALEVYAEPGDGAVVQTPIYPPFLHAVRETGRRLDENPLVAGANGYAMDLDALRDSTDERTRLVLLCNPHNPTGRVFARDELEDLAALAVERDWVVVTDEIHQDLVFAGRRYVPFASLGPAVAERTVTLTSATKAFNIPGLRFAVAHFGSRELQQRFLSVPRHLRGGLGLLGIHATAAAWQYGQPWLDHVMAHLTRNRGLVKDFVASELPGVVHHPPEATYLAWLDFRALALEPTPGRFFLREARLALSDGPLFGSPGEGHARLNFATSRDILQRVLEGISKAVRSR